LSFDDYKIDKWKRRSVVTQKIKELDHKYKPILSIYSLKNKGTWIIKDLIQDYGNWYGEIYKKVYKKDYFIDFGNYLNKNLIEFYRKITDNSYFMSLENGFIRINKENNFVFLTDLFNITNKDIKSFKKTRCCITYLQNNPTHYLSGNNYTDYFGIKVSYGHPTLALLILDWIYKKNCPEKEIFKKYITNALKRIEEIVETEESEEETEEETEEEIEEESEEE